MSQSPIKLRDVLPSCSSPCSTIVSASQRPAFRSAWLSKLPWSMSAPAIVLQLICHMHLSHRSDGCSCSQRLPRFPSDIYCSCVIFSYVSFCINTVASSELSPQTQSPRYQLSRPPHSSSRSSPLRPLSSSSLTASTSACATCATLVPLHR
jgi:hypothetical protein